MSKVSYLGVRNEPRGAAERLSRASRASTFHDRRRLQAGSNYYSRGNRLKKVLSDNRETNDKRSLSFANSFDNFPAKIT